MISACLATIGVIYAILIWHEESQSCMLSKTCSGLLVLGAVLTTLSGLAIEKEANECGKRIRPWWTTGIMKGFYKPVLQ